MRIAGYAFVASWIAQFVGHGKVSFRGPHQTAGEFGLPSALRIHLVHSLPSGLFRKQQCTDKEASFSRFRPFSSKAALPPCSTRSCSRSCSPSFSSGSKSSSSSGTARSYSSASRTRLESPSLSTARNAPPLSARMARTRRRNFDLGERSGGLESLSCLSGLTCPFLAPVFYF